MNQDLLIAVETHQKDVRLMPCVGRKQVENTPGIGARKETDTQWGVSQSRLESCPGHEQ